MAKTLTPIDITADTLETFITRANNIIDTLATEIVTANTDANGAAVSGNAHVNGIMSSVTMAATTLRGGNVQSTGLLTVSSNVQMGTGNTFFWGNTTVNSSVNSTSFSLSNSTVTFQITKPTAVQVADARTRLNANGDWVTSDDLVTETTFTATAAGLVDSYDISAYHAAEFAVYVNSTVANAKHFAKILTLYDGTDVDATEYAVIQSNGAIGSFSANANSTVARLYFTPTANCKVTVNKTVLPI